LTTFTGRSKTTGFNIQGMTSDYDIRPNVDGDILLVNFDWIAADLRMAAFMSQDAVMTESYDVSDPYTKIAEYFNNSHMDRAQCKHEFFKAFYSMTMNVPVMEPFPKFKEWVLTRIRQLNDNNYLDSCMGRRFYVNGDNKLSVFNAQFQGSVVHAMQSALIKIYDRYPNNILTEVHDSIIMFCGPNYLKQMIDDVVGIMIYPLDGLIDNSPRMPVEVSIGDRWRNWKKYKIFR
jgi:hypothetical protein